MRIEKLLGSVIDLDLAAESIALQSDAFKNSLTACYSDVLGKTREEIFSSDFDQRLSNIIFEYSGIRVKVFMGVARSEDLDMTWSVLLNPPTVNNSTVKDDTNYTLAMSKIAKMKFDFKRGRVTRGSEGFTPTLCVPAQELIDKRCSATEAAGVTLHEVGHAFYLLAFTGKFVTASIAMHEMTRSMDGVSSMEDRIAIIRRSTDPLDIQGLDAKELGKISDPTAISVVISDRLLHEFRSAVDTAQHDRSMFENLADMYAARHGAGADVASYLSRAYGNDYRGYNPYINWWSTASWLWMCLEVIVAVLKSATIFAAGGLWTLLAAMILAVLAAAPNEGFYRYDTTDDRIKRIRHQASLFLRDPKISKVNYLRVKADLEKLDKIWNEMPKDQTFDRYLSQLFSSVRKRRSDAQIQMEMEKLSHNPLYEIAADFRHAIA